jgi:hypothetical protein
MKKTALGMVGILLILIITLFLESAPINPAAFTPPEAPEFLGVLEANNLLQKAELLALGKISGPEEVALDKKGRVYAGTRKRGTGKLYLTASIS